MLTRCPKSVKGIQKKNAKSSQKGNPISSSLARTVFLSPRHQGSFHLSIKPLYLKQGKHIIHQNNNGTSTENFSRQNSAVCIGSPTAKRGSKYYPAGIMLRIILPQVQRNTDNNVLLMYSATMQVPILHNHIIILNTICYVAKVNFHHSKITKKMSLIFSFNNTTSRDIKLFVETCLAFYY